MLYRITICCSLYLGTKYRKGGPSTRLPFAASCGRYVCTRPLTGGTDHSGEQRVTAVTTCPDLRSQHLLASAERESGRELLTRPLEHLRWQWSRARAVDPKKKNEQEQYSTIADGRFRFTPRLRVAGGTSLLQSDGDILCYYVDAPAA